MTMTILRAITHRDVFLVLFGAASMQVRPSSSALLQTTLPRSWKPLFLDFLRIFGKKPLLVDPLAGSPIALSLLPHTFMAALRAGMQEIGQYEDLTYQLARIYCFLRCSVAYEFVFTIAIYESRRFVQKQRATMPLWTSPQRRIRLALNLDK